MQIIVLHAGLRQARSLTLSSRHLVIGLFLFVLSVLATAAALNLLVAGHGGNWLSAAGDPVQSEVDQKKDRYMKDNLTAMAIKLGEMQARLMRLDALGERVQGLAGIKPEEFNFHELPGRGGAEPSSTSMHVERNLSMTAFQEALDALARDVEHRADYMNVVETTLMDDKVRSRMLPTVQPVNVSYNASGFGWRFDPFNGRNAFHEGIDFPAPVGTPIVAAAGGVVIAAEYHHEFGNMLEIDHGNNIVTRYAHASRLLAKIGDIVQRGQHVADTGSTGRSTGAHLHFEVLVKGVPQNPNKFLIAGASHTSIATLAAK
jgi:murein DD-endopeptidase MepM/ murein hydrolase activator NlpD